MLSAHEQLLAVLPVKGSEVGSDLGHPLVGSLALCVPPPY